MKKQTIYVTAYPKSGSTWLTRLLGDVLDSPTGGCMPEEDGVDVASGGHDRPGSYFVRRGHFTLIDNDTGAVVPQPHQLAWKRLTDEYVIFLVRDPRDICVSGAYHWQTSVKRFLKQMIKGEVAGLERWDKYCERWIYHSRWKRGQFVHTRYVDLLRDGAFEMQSVLKWLGVRGKDIPGALKRQSFEASRASLGVDELRTNNIRKGIAGDWHNHFTPAMNGQIWNEFG